MAAMDGNLMVPPRNDVLQARCIRQSLSVKSRSRIKHAIETRRAEPDTLPANPAPQERAVAHQSPSASAAVFRRHRYFLAQDVLFYGSNGVS